MPYIEPYYDKSGHISSFRITVYDGTDFSGARKRHRKTWKPKPGMTDRQAEAAVQRIAFEFEKEIYDGFRVDDTQTFAQYAEYVLELKERNGVRPRTIDRYKDMLARINDSIGAMKLTEIRPQHLNEFYKYLSEVGIRDSKEKAIAKVNLESMVARREIPKDRLAKSVGLAPTTFRSAISGNQVSLKTAEKVAEALGMEVKDAFRVSKDTSKLSNKTILEYHRLISTIMAQAEKEMIVHYNPAARASPPKPQKPEPDYFQPDVLNDILVALENVPLKWKAISYLLIDTGCRRGEAIGLRWDCVDFDTGIIVIKRSVLYDTKRGIIEGPTKTGNVRAVKIAPQTLQLLKEVRNTQIAEGLKGGRGWDKNGFVFAREDGKPINPDAVTGWFAKFSAENGLPHIHPHAFRHTAASIMIASGIDLVTTANELGHANATTTATIYAHQITVAKAKASEARASVFSRVKAGNE